MHGVVRIAAMECGRVAGRFVVAAAWGLFVQSLTLQNTR